MFDTVFGLPVHPLVVHATVVLVPLAALTVLLAGVSARFRRWAGVLPLLLAAVAVVLAPVSIQSGRALLRRLGETAQRQRHQELGETLIYAAAALLVAAIVLWLLRRREVRGDAGTGLRVAAGVLAVLAGVGAMVDVALIGHSGATSVWSGVVSEGEQ